MTAWRQAIELSIADQDLAKLVSMTRSRTEPASRVERARMLLAYREDPSFFAVGQNLRMHHQTVQRCVERALAYGPMAALDDRPRSGKEPTITAEAKAWLVSLACRKAKELGYPHELWTTRLLARHAREHGAPAGHRCLANLVQGTVCKILGQEEIKPHKVRYYLERRDAEFEQKMAEVLCVYREVQVLKKAAAIPYRFEFTNKLTRQHKLLIAFDTLALSEAVGRVVTLGKIMHGDSRATLKVKISAFASEVRKQIKEITALLAGNSPPGLVLNRHCGQCEFKARCSTQAREKDELSLLSGMSENDRQRLHSKGIFTVTQLSYTFRPRRRRRETRGKQEKHQHSLRALAIRENKIHAVGIPDLKLKGTPVFLDVEGLPDRDFYYLIGISVQTAEGSVQHSFWADDAIGEKLIWNDFLDILSKIKDPHLIHYGSYETIFLKRMCERHGRPPAGSQVATAIDHATNLLSFIYAQIYFPPYSNGLKEIAGHLGFRWSGSLTSGLETIVLRHRWEASRNPEVKQALLDYNQQDCEAIELVANRLVDLHRAAPAGGGSSQREVVLTSDMKRESLYRFGRIAFALPEMETINKAAYWDYQRERVYVKSGKKVPRCNVPAPTRQDKPKPNTTIGYQAASHCPNCKSMKIYSHGTRIKTVIDLRFMRYG